MLSSSASVSFANFKHESITLHGATIHYWTNEQIGKPVVFLLHGAAMDHGMFEPQLDALADYHVIAWDARGHGASRPIKGTFNLTTLANDCLAILDEANATTANVILMGQSEGGMIAQEVYRLQSDRIKGIVTIGASPIMIRYSRIDIWLLKFSAGIIKVWPYGNFITALARKTAIKSETQNYALGAVRNISKKDFLSIWNVVTNSITHSGIPNMHISIPLLITYGQFDTTGTVKKNSIRWKQYEPDAQLEIIPDAGHNANQDNALFFNTLLVRFLSESI